MYRNPDTMSFIDDIIDMADQEKEEEGEEVEGEEQ